MASNIISLAEHTGDPHHESLDDFFDKVKKIYLKKKINKCMIIGLDEGLSSMMYMRDIRPSEVVLTFESLKNILLEDLSSR